MLRRSVTLSCMVMALMMTMGCNWDSGLYKEYVNDNGRIVRCPPEIIIKGENVEVKFPSLICKNNSVTLVGNGINDENALKDCIDSKTNKCREDNDVSDKCDKFCNEYILDYLACKNFQSNGFFDDVKKSTNIFDVLNKSSNISYVGVGTNLIGNYPDLKNRNICPKDYPICSYKKGDENEFLFGCVENTVKQCSEGQIICDDKCVTPGEFGHYCGAKGKCSSDEPASLDYKGMTCADDLICNNGMCVCEEGLIRCDDKCINPKADINYCGALNCEGGEKGNKCPELGYCDDGKCKCQEGSINCNGVCVNPKYDNEYCGAKNACKDNDKGQPCKSNEQCRNGECVLEFCQDKNKCAVSSDADKFECIDVTLNDDKNCGACNLECSSNDTTEYKCQSGKCNIISCKNNLTKCSRKDSEGKTLDDFLCVDTKSNSMYCGDKCNYCEDGTYCKNGKCEETTCPNKPNTCLNDPDNCNNRINACGTSCIDCTLISHAKNVSCNDNTGMCEFECEAPFEKNNNVCGCDSDDYCVNKNPEWKSGICWDGVCTVTECIDAYEIYNGTCVKKDELCGGIMDCYGELSKSEHSHIVEAGCNDNKCVVKKCEPGFHISKDQRSCTENNSNDCAPSNSFESINCNDIPMWKKSYCDKDGVCVAKECEQFGGVETGRCVRKRTKNSYKACGDNKNWICYCDCDWNGFVVDSVGNMDMANTIYCMTNDEKYYGYNILSCKNGYRLVREPADEAFCEKSCSICYKDENGKLYRNICKME